MKENYKDIFYGLLSRMGDDLLLEEKADDTINADFDLSNKENQKQGQDSTKLGQVPVRGNCRQKEKEKDNANDVDVVDNDPNLNQTKIIFDSTPLIYKILLQKKILTGSKQDPEHDYQKYTLGIVKALCRKIKDEEFVIFDDRNIDVESVYDFENKTGNLIGLKEGADDNLIKAWFAKYAGQFKNNIAGRFGSVFELLMGNKPDSEPLPDFMNAEDSEQSTEAKTKTNKSEAISITTSKLESIEASLEQVSNNLKNACNESIDKISNLINNEIVNDIRKNYPNSQVLLAKQITTSKAISLLDDGEKGGIKKIVTITFFAKSPEEFFGFEQTYDIYCQVKDFDFNNINLLFYIINSAVRNRAFDAEIPNDDKTEQQNNDQEFDFGLNESRLKNKNVLKIEASVSIPFDVIPFKILNKCPNIVVAYGKAEDKLIYGHKATSYYFSGFDFFKKNNALVSRQEVNKCMVDMISYRAFDVKLTVEGNYSSGPGRETGKGSIGRQNSISLRIMPSFNVKKFIAYINAHGTDALYVKA